MKKELTAIAMTVIICTGISMVMFQLEKATTSITELKSHVLRLDNNVQILSEQVKKDKAEIVNKDMILNELINAKVFKAEECFKLREIILEKSMQLKITPKSILAVMRVESDMNPKSIFGGICEGLNGVQSCAKLEAIGNLKDYKWDDPVKNTIVFLEYLTYMRDLPRFKTANEDTLLKAWNRGPFWKDLDDTKGKQYQRKLSYYRLQIKGGTL